jgi:parvulin-like peptidyl-prolyl isomerase
MKRVNHRYWFMGLVMGVIFIIGLPMGLKTLEAQTPFGYHALKINGKFVSPEIFQRERSNFFQRWRRNAAMLRKTDEERNDLMLEEIINQVVIEDYLYHRAKVTVTSREVEEYINRYIKPRYTTIAGMNTYMSESGNNSMADLKKTIEVYLYKLKCFSKIAKELGVTVPVVELETKYQQHINDNRRAIVSHILISNPDPEKALKLAGQVYSQLKNGADFSKLAAQYSADDQTKSKGGRLDSILKDNTMPEVAEKVFNAKDGALIPPFQTRMGYEIIRVEKYINFFHPKTEFADMMLIEKFGTSDQYQKWLVQLKAKQKIEILDPAMKAYRFYRDGQFDKAGSFYEKAYAVDKFENYLIRAIESYQAAEKWAKLIELGRFGIRKFPAKVTYYLNQAEGLYRTGKVQAALNVMKHAEGLAVNNIYYSNLVSQMYSKLGFENEAARVKHKNNLP